MKQIAVLVGISIIWSLSWLVFKYGVRTVPALTLASMRFLLAVPVLSFVAWRRGVALPRNGHDWLWLALAGLSAFALNYVLVFWGSQFIPAGLSTVLQATIPACTLLLGLIWLPDEKVSVLGVASIVTGIAGVLIIFWDQLRLSDPMALWGCIALAITALTNSIGTIIIKRSLTHLNGIQLALGQQMMGLPVLMGVAVASDGLPRFNEWSAQAVLAILYMGLCSSVIAFLAYYWLLRQWPATKAMLYAILMPVFTMLLAWIFLGESLTPLTLLGGAIVLGSVALAMRKAPITQESPLTQQEN